MPTLGEYILNIIYPLSCAVCRTRLKADNKVHLCDNCCRRICTVTSPYCPRPDIKTKIYFRRAQAVGRYEGILKECIHLVKYGRKKPLNKTLSGLMIDHISNYFNLDAFDFLVPVPLHKRQRRKRGFNQAELLTENIARHFDKPAITDNLRRSRHTEPQYKLNKPERIKNMKAAFSVNRPEVFCGRSILLIDDVYTTGVTVNECARVLSKAGASSVEVLVLAHGS